MDKWEIEKGDQIADIGAGTGNYSIEMAKKLKDDKQWGLKQLDLDDIIEEFENTVNEVLQTGVDDNENKPSQAAKPYPRKNPPAWARIEKIKEEREIEKLFDPFDGL